MRVRIIKSFRDRDNFAKVYDVDSIVDLPAERARELKALKLVAEIRDKNSKTAKKWQSLKQLSDQYSPMPLMRR